MPRSNAKTRGSAPEPSSAEPSEGAKSTRQLPADDIPELVAQLRRELDRLESAEAGSDEEDESFRRVIAYVEKSQSITWRRVVESDLKAPAEALEGLAVLSPFADRHFPDLPKRAHASTVIHQVLRGLRTADQALHKARITARIRDRELSKIERGILGVLARSEYQLRRGQIHEQLPESIRPSVARVGQILVDFHYEGLLHRTEAVAQGNPNTAFYRLTPLGREVYNSLGPLQSATARKPPEQANPESPRLRDFLSRLIKDSGDQRVALGLLESFLRNQAQVWLILFVAARALEQSDATCDLVEFIDRLAQEAYAASRHHPTQAGLRK